MLNYSNISPEEEFRILDFLNKAKSVDDILNPNILHDDPSSGFGDQINDPTIGSLVAMRILDKRDTCPGKVFTRLEQLDNILGFGQDKLQDLVFSLNKRNAAQRQKTRSILQPVIYTKGSEPPIPPEPTPLPSNVGQVDEIKLEDKDIGDLEQVLRSYYIDQINTLEGWKNRKLARILIEDHLVLPKSQQRTSKDGAYIKEKLGIEGFVLERLEDTRLIRKISRRGVNPIYEVSHDTLVEPILAERRNKELLGLFIKKWGKYLALLLLLFLSLGLLLGNYISNPEPGKADKIVKIGRIGIDWPNNPEEGTIEITDSIRKELQFAKSVSFDLEMQPKVPGPENTRGRTSVDFYHTVNIDLSQLEVIDGVPKDTSMLIQNNVRTKYVMRDGTNQRLKAFDSEVDVNEYLTIKFDGEHGHSTLAETPNLPLPPIRIKLSNAASPLVVNQKYELKNFAKKINLSSYLTDDPRDQLIKSFFENRKVEILYDLHAKPRYIYDEVGGNIRLDPDGVAIEFTTKGKKLYTQKPYAATSSNGQNMRSSQALFQKGATHEVRKGETLYSIAKIYGTSDIELRIINNLKNNNIRPGQVLIKPK